MIERIKLWLVKILNMFAMPIISSNSSRGISIVVFMFVAICIGLCAWVTLVDIPEKFVLMVDNVTLPQKNKVTIGYNSDIHFASIPHDYLEVTKNGDGISWKVNASETDTLQYFKINNDNPNAHAVENSESQKIDICIPFSDATGKKDTIKVSLTGKDIWNEWNSFDKQEHVMVRHLLAHYECRKGGVSHEDSIRYESQIENQAVRSFFNCSHNKLGRIAGIKLVILDNYVKINNEGYMFSGTSDGNRCKVQFFRVASYCYKDDSSEGDYFQFKGVNYVMKPLVKLSSWGAGHIMLDMNGNNTKVSFPKAVGYVGSVDSLKNAALGSSSVITFRQAERSFPSSSDIFLPYFSHGYNQEICNLAFSTDGKTLYIKDNSNDSVKVENPSSFTQMVPALRKMTLKAGNAKIDARTGYINKSFMFEYVKLPLLVTLLLLLLIFSPWSPLKTDSMTKGIYSSEQLKSYPLYLATLLIVGFAYTICKSMIALKLSYTFPYFEKMTGITPFNTSMMLLVFFTMLLIINSTIVSLKSPTSRNSKSGMKRFVAVTYIAAIFAGLCYMLFFISDPQISYGIIDSYYPSEIGINHNWLSQSAFGANDNHRTVCYALIVVEGALLFVLSIIYIIGGNRIVNSVSSKYNAIVGKIPFSKKLSEIWDALIVGRYWKNAVVEKSAPKNWKERIQVYLRDCVSHIPVCVVLLAAALLVWIFVGFAFAMVVAGFTLIVFLLDFVHDALLAALRTLAPGHILLILLLAVGGSMLGNFGTAFITLCVILGFTKAISNVKFSDPNNPQKADLPRHVVLTEMVLISIFYIVGAMMADNGYMTNYIGFLMLIICVYFVLLRPGRGRVVAQTDKIERRWVIGTLVVVVALVLLLPTICSKLFNSDKVDYSRMSRRVCLYSNFDNIMNSGYRYSESDAEFMVVMSHYMQMKDGGDPLSNDTHFLHSSVSTGQSPVVLNDLSVPIAFFGSYGIMSTTVVYFLLLFCLLLLVLHFSFSYGGRYDHLFTRAMQWRILAVFMWVGTSLYIYFSYLGHLPFTGRLNPGYGVDAVGEVLESAFLLAFMGGITVRPSDEKEEPARKKTKAEPEKPSKEDDDVEVTVVEVVTPEKPEEKKVIEKPKEEKRPEKPVEKKKDNDVFDLFGDAPDKADDSSRTSEKSKSSGTAKKSTSDDSVFEL